MSKIRKRFIFRGYVQGVGFRYRASNSANHLGLTGWVRTFFMGILFSFNALFTAGLLRKKE